MPSPLSARPPAILLMGPTASGKTGLALRLIQRFPLEIVSVDSAQVYRQMDVGTAKPDRRTLAAAPGLGQLVASYGSLSKTKGGLKLLHVNKKNHDLLSITRLVTIFDTFDSEDEAVKSFAPAALA